MDVRHYYNFELLYTANDFDGPKDFVNGDLVGPSSRLLGAHRTNQRQLQTHSTWLVGPSEEIWSWMKLGSPKLLAGYKRCDCGNSAHLPVELAILGGSDDLLFSSICFSFGTLRE